MPDYNVIKGTRAIDKLIGTIGADLIRGREGNDIIKAGKGADNIEGGPGSDIIKAGGGADTIYTLSWAGEPYIANPRYLPIGFKVEDDEPLENNDVITTGRGRDTLVFRWLIDAKTEIEFKHRDEDGKIDYRAVAGENQRDHDHWVESIGHITVTDFDPEKDTLVFEGHTVRVQAVIHEDVNGDGEVDTVVHFYSEQGWSGAHDDDYLGSVTFLSAWVDVDDDDINRDVFYGVESPWDVGLG